MDPSKPLINQKFLLQKFPGKGGWTYTEVPGVLQNKNAPFGFVRVRGSIDGYEIKGYHMMPMKNGKLFLPIKAAIRKKIGKEKGDYVHVILYADNPPTELPEELRICLEDEPDAFRAFNSATETEKLNLLRYIYSAKTEEDKIERIAGTINKLIKGKPTIDKNIINRKHIKS